MELDSSFKSFDGGNAFDFPESIKNAMKMFCVFHENRDQSFEMGSCGIDIDTADIGIVIPNDCIGDFIEQARTIFAFERNCGKIFAILHGSPLQ